MCGGQRMKQSDKKEVIGMINTLVFIWLFGLCLSIFVLGFVFGDYYTETNQFNHTCNEIKDMLILDEFDNFYPKITYIDTWFADRLVWNSHFDKRIDEDELRIHYLLNCKKDVNVLEDEE